MQFHPVADLFPLMSTEEAAALRADIATNGLREAIWTHDGQIIDGRNRYLACEAVEVEPRYRPYEGDPKQLVSFVVSLNLKRRHLTESQRAMVAAKLANIDERGRPQKNTQICGISSQAEAAQLLNVGQRSVSSARKVVKDGVPELVAMVESGALPVSRAATLATLSEKKQRQIIRSGRASGKKVLERLRKESLKNTDKGYISCLHCSPIAKFDPPTVSAFLQKLIQKATEYAREHGTENMGPYFDSIVFEIEEARLGDLQMSNFDKVLAAIDAGTVDGETGIIEKSDLQRMVRISTAEFNDVIAKMIMTKKIEPVKQGGKTDGARGARKTLFKRREVITTGELQYDLDDEREDVYVDNFAENWR